MNLIKAGANTLPNIMNFGCGNKISINQVNIDIHFSKVMLQSILLSEEKNNTWVLMGKLTNPHYFPRGHFYQINCFDVLEHFHPDEIPNILYCFRECLNPQGTLRIIVPDFEKMAGDLLKITKSAQGTGKYNVQGLDIHRKIEMHWMAPYMHTEFGGHKSIWTRAVARHLLEREGFEIKSIRTIVDMSYSMEILACLL